MPNRYVRIYPESAMSTPVGFSMTAANSIKNVEQYFNTLTSDYVARSTGTDGPEGAVSKAYMEIFPPIADSEVALGALRKACEENIYTNHEDGYLIDNRQAMPNGPHELPWDQVRSEWVSL